MKIHRLATFALLGAIFSLGGVQSSYADHRQGHEPGGGGGLPDESGIDTNAETLCGPGELLDGDGNCIPIPEDTNTDAETKCEGEEVLLGNGGCVSITALLNFQLTLEPKTVFVLGNSIVPVIGVENADAGCQANADAAGLPGTYVAWLSTKTPLMHAKDRILDPDAQYINTNGDIVADDKADLLDGTLDNAIGYFADGTPAANIQVWTGTGVDGTLLDPGNCGSWTTNSGAAVGGIGRSDVTDGSWTHSLSIGCNSLGRRLYCFEQ